MTIRHVAAVASVVLALVGCGEDGNDADAGRTLAGASATADDEAPQIQVVGVSETSDHEAHGSDEGSEPPHEDDAGMAEMGDDDGHDGRADHDAVGTTDVAHTAHEATETDHDSEGSAHDAAEPEQDHTDDAAAGTDPDDGEHVVEVTMFEFGYALDHDTVPAGVPVTFRFVNEGQIEHEAMFGSMHQQEEFAASDDHGDHGSEGHHGEIAAITLDAAADGEMTMIFDSLGEVLIGCHLPGHWEAGMSASLEVVAA